MTHRRDPNARLESHPFEAGFKAASDETLELARHCHWWLVQHRGKKGKRIVRKRKVMFKLFEGFKKMQGLLNEGAAMKIQITA